MRCMGRTRGEVHEEWLVRHERLLALDPGDGVIGHVFSEVVALLGSLIRLHRGDPVVESRVPLVGLGAHKTVEVLEAASGGPLVERPHRAGLPHRNLVALAELGRAVAVEQQGLGDGRCVVRADRVVPGRGRGNLGDPSHADRMVVPGGQQRLAGRRAQGGRVEPVESQSVGSQPVGHRSVTWSPEGR